MLFRSRDFGITSADQESERSSIWIVAESMGVESKEVALQMYREGESPSPETLRQVNQYKATKRLEAHEADVKSEKQRRSAAPPKLIGKDKYLKWATSAEEKASARAAELEKSAEAMLAYPQTYEAPQKSIAGEALKGQLIGGGAWAAANAHEAREFNRSAKSDHASLSEGLARIAVRDREKAAASRDEAKFYREYIREIKGRLIDLDHTAQYAELISCSATDVRLTEGGNISFHVAFNISRDAQVLKRKALLDGVYGIKAKLDSRVIGSTVYCPRLYTKQLKSHSTVRTGFGVPEWESVLILTTENVTEDNVPSIEFAFEPRIIWAIECKEDGSLY